MQRLKNNLPAIAFLLGGGVVLAQSASTAARTFPYVGYLEENGVAVNGTRDVVIDLFTGQSGGSSCDTASFDDVVVSGGRFQVEIESVPDACLKSGELYLTLSVGPAGGTLTALATSSGLRSRIHSVPFASANDKSNDFLAGTSRGIVFETSAGQTRLFGDTSGATGVTLQPRVEIADTSALFLVKSFDGSERLRINDNDTMTVGQKLSVSGTTTMTGALQVNAALTATGAVNANGAVINVPHSANSARINFTSAGGSNNDPGLIEHFESANVGELWINTSDDWSANSTATEDRIVFGTRSSNVVKHEFDAAGDAFHARDVFVGDDLDVAGAISSSCPGGMTFVAGWCIDTARSNNSAVQNFSAAMSFCHNAGKMLCPYDALLACDEINPSGADCTSQLDNGNAILWTSTRHLNREPDFGESWRFNIACYDGDDTVDECFNTESHDYYCCTHAFTGTP